MGLALVLVLVLVISYAGSAVEAASTTTTTTNLTLSAKIPPPPGVLINSGNMCFVNSVLHIMVCCLGCLPSGVGLSGIAGTSGNGTAAEASAYLLLEGTQTQTSTGK